MRIAGGSESKRPKHTPTILRWPVLIDAAAEAVAVAAVADAEAIADDIGIEERESRRRKGSWSKGPNGNG